jgi:hypothetical protein
LPREAVMQNLKLRAVPYIGAITFIASLAGYAGTR